MKSDRYRTDQHLSELIADNSLLLMAMSRFALPLRYAGRSVADACAAAGVHAETFLCVANMISGRSFSPESVDLAALTSYLKRAHAFFLDFFLPEIRRKIIGAIDFSGSADAPLLILRFFDGYVEEVRRHMDYENSTLFRYVDAIIEGRLIEGDYSVAVFASHHDAISEKLSLLKDVLIRYSSEGNADRLNSVLFDIINCEADLISHCEVEDRILVPAVRKAEEAAVRTSAAAADAAAPKSEETEVAPVLGKREKEIVECIARGMSNKEIADKLCISVNTVTTHRRNICSKLEIHSPAGLTIYAILNGLIDPNEVEI